MPAIAKLIRHTPADVSDDSSIYICPARRHSLA